MGVRLLILVLSVPCIVAQSPTYTITAPNTVRANTDFPVAVTNHGSGGTIRVAIQVIGQEYQQGTVEGQKYTATGEITVLEKVTQIVKLKIGNWEPGNYRLQCNGSGAVTFVRTTPLNFNKKTFSMLIQMDKAIYQRGQTVHFRVVSFNANLLPYNNGTLSVYVNDADGNRIKQWNVPVPKIGIYENELQLSDQPVIGIWQLQAHIMDVVATKEFEVSEYVLPKFDVDVIPPPFITLDDVAFPVNFTVLYTNGVQVSGTYLVNVTETYCTYPYVSNCPSRPVVLTGSFKGSAQVIVRIGDLQLGKNYYGTSLTIVVIVTEDNTNIKRNSSVTLSIYPNTLQLQIQQESNFKPQTPHTFTVKLVYQNGAPVKSPCPKGPVNITVNYGEGIDTEKIIGEFNDDGTLSKTITPPAYAEQLSITVLYDKMTGYGYASKSPSLSDKYVSLSVENKYPKVGDTLKVKVTATFKTDGAFSYQVVGRGLILIAKTAVLTTNSFSFKLTRDMAPRVSIIGFYVTGCGEIVGDSLDISVDGVLQNQVTLRLSTNTSAPGKNITIDIECKPNSTVGMLAVDESVLLLKSGNDITKEQIANTLEEYNQGSTRYYFDDYYGGIIRRPPYGGSLDELFVYVGLVLFTNGLVFKQNTCYRPMYFKGGFVDDVAFIAEAAPAGGGGGLVQPTRIRSYFPEVGIWATSYTNTNGKAMMTWTVPDTLTRYIVTALAMNFQDGLGTSNVPSNLTVTQMFFIVFNVPRFVIRTEVLTVQALVFNNFKQELPQVVVTLNKTNNPSAYDFLESTGDNANVVTKTIKIGANGVTLVTFRIKPKVVGYIFLDCKAVSALAGDQLLQPLLVKAEGTTQYKVNSVFMDLRTINSFGATIGIIIPSNAVPDSQFIECAALGDIMAPVVENFKELLRIPSGCGEQNMINFVPDVVLLIYLGAIGQLTPEFNKTAISYLEIGYITQLTYKRSDGSFSAFGKSDTNGSTWLTAYVLNCFLMGSDFITIDPNVIDNAKKFLVSKQANDGQFIEDGRVIHKAMQGGSTTGLASTAFVVIAFKEKKNQNNSAYDAAIKKAVKYLEDNLDSANNSYEMAIVCYALHLVESPKRNSLFDKLYARKITEGDLSYWSYKVSTSGGTEASYDVETTSYCLLILYLRSDIANNFILPIIRWLISRRSSLGGYDSSQDTVMGIKALAVWGPKFAAPQGSSIEITLTYLTKTTQFKLNKENALILQKVQIPKETKNVFVKATGSGVGIVQCAWNYNIVESGIKVSSFKVLTTVRRPNDQTYSVTIVFSALYNKTNMLLVEFNCLSGYSLDRDSVPAPGYVSHLTRVDLSDGNTRAVFYFDELTTTSDSVKFTVNAVKNYEVSELKNADVLFYDYYEQTKRAQVSYNLPTNVG